MKRRILLLLFILVLGQVLLTGCSTGNGPGVFLDGNGQQARENKEAKSTQAPPADENMAVVTDTVVDVFREPDVQSERVTQAIYNQPVSILESRENWMKVKVVDGYTGWLKSRYVDKDCTSIKADSYKYRLVVTGKVKKIYSSFKNGVTLKETVMGTELYCIGREDDWYEVVLPQKQRGWINESGTIRLSPKEHIPRTSADDFVMTANKLKGSTYVWGGVSAWGIDCSGLVYMSARINGVDLPRDADQQSREGEAVTGGMDAMKPGDLVFFSSDTDLKDISHIGIFIGNKQFVHASSAKGSVVTGSLEEDYYKRRLAGVRRVF